MRWLIIFRWLLLIGTVALAIVVFIKADGNSLMYIIGAFLLFLFAYQIYIMLRPGEMRLLVDKDEATAYYIDWLYKNRKVSIPEDFEEYFSDETETMYRMVFRWHDMEDGHKLYAPIEIYKFYVQDKDGNQVIQLGHGRGKITKNNDEVEAFVLRDLKAIEKSHVINIINEQLEQSLNKKLEEYGMNNNKEDQI